MTSQAPSAFLHDALIFLLAAVLVVTAFRAARLNAIIGYLIAGAVIGPYGLGWVGEVEGTHRLAELGVVFLLFAVGLELTYQRLHILAVQGASVGLLQMAITGAVISAGSWLLGFSWSQAAIIGGALALSSTAFVLQGFADRGELASRAGSVALAILLLQDLLVVPGIALINALSQQTTDVALSLLTAVATATGAIVALLLIGRWGLRPVLHAVARTKTPELFFGAVLLVILGTAWMTQQLGLSMALGAFLGGIALAGTEFRHQIEADIYPIRGILLALFFISVGMLVDLQAIASDWATVLALVLCLIVVKAGLLAMICMAFRQSLSSSLSLGLMLAQGGEFGFILLTLAQNGKLLASSTVQVLIAVITISMALTPLLNWLAAIAQRRLDARGKRMTVQDLALDPAADVVIAGFGRVGRIASDMLSAANVRWVAIDRDPAVVAAAREQSLPVYFGDARHESVLRSVGVRTARTVLITAHQQADALSLVRALRQRCPEISIVVRARDEICARDLLDLGATDAIPEMTEAARMLGRGVLKRLGVVTPDSE